MLRRPLEHVSVQPRCMPRVVDHHAQLWHVWLSLLASGIPRSEIWRAVVENVGDCCLLMDWSNAVMYLLWEQTYLVWRSWRRDVCGVECF